MLGRITSGKAPRIINLFKYKLYDSNYYNLLRKVWKTMYGTGRTAKVHLTGEYSILHVQLILCIKLKVFWKSYNWNLEKILAPK